VNSSPAAAHPIRQMAALRRPRRGIVIIEAMRSTIAKWITVGVLNPVTAFRSVGVARSIRSRRV